MNGSESLGRSRRLIICMQDKGGCGRSTCASLLVDWFRRRRGIRVALFEPADRRGRMGAIYGPVGSAPLSPPNRYDVIDWLDPQMGICSIDEIVRCLGVDQPAEADVSVLDASANATASLLHWFRETRIASVARQFGIGVTVVVPVDGTADSARNAEALLHGLDISVDVLVIRNAKGVKRIPWDGCAFAARYARENRLETEIPCFGEQLSCYLEMQAFRRKRLSLLGVSEGPNEVARNQARECLAVVEQSLVSVARILLPGGPNGATSF